MSLFLDIYAYATEAVRELRNLATKKYVQQACMVILVYHVPIWIFCFSEGL